MQGVKAQRATLTFKVYVVADFGEDVRGCISMVERTQYAAASEQSSSV